MKRIISLLLSLSIALSCVGMPVWATGTDTPDQPAVETPVEEAPGNGAPALDGTIELNPVDINDIIETPPVDETPASPDSSNPQDTKPTPPVEETPTDGIGDNTSGSPTEKTPDETSPTEETTTETPNEETAPVDPLVLPIDEFRTWVSKQSDEDLGAWWDALLEANPDVELTDEQQMILGERFYDEPETTDGDGYVFAATGDPSITPPTNETDKPIEITLDRFNTSSMTVSIEGAYDNPIISQTPQNIVTTKSEVKRSTTTTIRKNATPTDNTAGTLEYCEYTFTPVTGSKNTFTVQSVKNTNLYMGANTTVSGSYPNQTSAANIVISTPTGNNVKPGSFTLTDSTNNNTHFYFGVTAIGGENLYSFAFNTGSFKKTDYTNCLYLFKKDTTSQENKTYDLIQGYELVKSTEELESGGQYLVAAMVGNRIFLLRPCANDGWWVEHVAEYDGITTDLTFTPATTTNDAANTTVTVQDNSKNLNLTYKVTVTSSVLPAAVMTQMVPQDVFIMSDAERTITYEFGLLDSVTSATGKLELKTMDGNKPTSGHDVTMSSVDMNQITKTDTVLTYSSETVQKNQDDDSSIVSQPHYLASHCLYTFTGTDTNGYTIKSAEDSTIGLGSTIGAKYGTDYQFKIEKAGQSDTSGFTIKYGTNYANTFYFNGWLNFNGTSHNTIPNVTTMHLYEPVTEGDGSSELPGYRQVTSIESDKKYLIVACLNSKLYLVRPYQWSGSGSRNVHVAEVAGYTEGSTQFRIKADPLTTTESLKTTITLQKGNNSCVCPVRVLSTMFISKTGQASGNAISKLVISTGMTYDVTLGNDDGTSEITWTSSDSSILSVDNGRLTAISWDGSQNEEKTVTITATLGSASYTLPVVVAQNTYTNYKVMDIYVDEITHTKVWASFPAKGNTNYFDGQNFLEIQEHQVMYMLRDNNQPCAVDFFAKPDGEHYVLTSMGATGTYGHYLKLENENAEKTEFYTTVGAAGFNQCNIYGASVIAAMIQHAIGKKCVGAMGFTKDTGNNSGIYSSVSFVSCLLPSISKSVAYMIPYGNGSDYETAQAAANAFREATNGNTKLQENSPLQKYKFEQAKTYEGNNYLAVFTVDVTTYEEKTSGDSGLIDCKALIVTDNLEKSFFFENMNDSHTLPSNDNENLRKLTFPPTDSNVTVNINQDRTYTHFVGYDLANAASTSDTTSSDIVNTADLVIQYGTKFHPQGGYSNTSTATAALRYKVSDEMKFVNLTLGGNIGANVYFADKQDASWKNSYYVIFKVDDDVTKIKFANGENSTIKATNYRRFSVSVSPQQMTTPIEVYLADKNDTKISEVKSFTIATYGKVLLENSNQEKLINNWTVNGAAPIGSAITEQNKLQKLIKAMLNYGAYTQTYTRTNTDNLANTSLGEGETTPAGPTDINGSGNKGYQLPDEDAAKAANIQFTGIALENGSTLGMRIYFRAYDSKNPVTSLTVKTVHVEGNWALTNTASIEQDNDGFYIPVRGIYSNWLTNTYRITITNQNTDNKQVSIDIQPLAYVYLLLSQENENTDLTNMVKAMYDYCEAAKDYFGSSTTNPTNSTNS